MRIPSIVSVFAFAAACGGGTGISGSVSGKKVAAVNGAYASQYALPGADGEFWLYISISDSAQVCTAHQSNAEPKISKTFFLELFQWQADGHFGDLAAGTYTVPPPTNPSDGKFANAYFGDFSGDNCQDTIGSAGQATAGTVKLDKVDVTGNAVAGSFAVTFGSDKVTGTFTVPTCSGNPAFGGCFP